LGNVKVIMELMAGLCSVGGR